MSEKKHPNFLSINEKVAEGIKKTANDSAVDRVVAKRVEAEVTRRADLLEKGLEKYNSTKKEIEKCKPDNVFYTIVDDVSVKNESWSEKKLNERKNLLELIAKLDVAIMKAMSENDYSKLQQLIGSGKQTQKPEEE